MLSLVDLERERVIFKIVTTICSLKKNGFSRDFQWIKLLFSSRETSIEKVYKKKTFHFLLKNMH